MADGENATMKRDQISAVDPASDEPCRSPNAIS
jgi:hypothetical protein